MILWLLLTTTDPKIKSTHLMCIVNYNEGANPIRGLLAHGKAGNPRSCSSFNRLPLISIQQGVHDIREYEWRWTWELGNGVLFQSLLQHLWINLPIYLNQILLGSLDQSKNLIHPRKLCGNAVVWILWPRPPPGSLLVVWTKLCGGLFVFYEIILASQGWRMVIWALPSSSHCPKWV